MATLQKIRSMGWVLVVIVGLAMLAFCAATVIKMKKKQAE